MSSGVWALLEGHDQELHQLHKKIQSAAYIVSFGHDVCPIAKCTLCDQNEKRYNVQFYRVFPDLVPFWDYESNNHNTPENVFIKNNFMVWLKCPNNSNHRWFIRLPPNELSSPQYEASILIMFNGIDPIECPYCQPQTKNNTYNQRKELLKWFHPTLNRFENFDIFKADLAAYNQVWSSLVHSMTSTIGFSVPKTRRMCGNQVLQPWPRGWVCMLVVLFIAL